MEIIFLPTNTSACGTTPTKDLKLHLSYIKFSGSAEDPKREVVMFGLPCKDKFPKPEYSKDSKAQKLQQTPSYRKEGRRNCCYSSATSLPHSYHPGAMLFDTEIWFKRIFLWASLVAQMVKNLPAVQANPGSIPGSGRSREGNGYPLYYSCLGNPMDRGAWRATVCGVTKSWIWLSD